MEVRFLVDIDPAEPTGLFNAVMARVACVPDSVTYNLSYFDTTFLRFLKKFSGVTAKEKKLPFEIEYLSRKDKINEYLLTNLRTRWGVSLKHLKQQWGYELSMDDQNYLRDLVERKLCKVENDTITLSSSGFLVADSISARLFTDL